MDTLGGPVCDKMLKSKLGKLVNDQSVDDALQQLVKVDQYTDHRGMSAADSNAQISILQSLELKQSPIVNPDLASNPHSPGSPLL